MKIIDDVAKRKLELMREDVEKGIDYTKPWLDLDINAYQAYRNGEIYILPAPFCDNPVDVVMMTGVRGKDVLCLAGGGGQQSAVFSLLGAKVTVLDLTPEQLEMAGAGADVVRLSVGIEDVADIIADLDQAMS